VHVVSSWFLRLVHVVAFLVEGSVMYFLIFTLMSL
jgi:hypothetical protein